MYDAGSEQRPRVGVLQGMGGQGKTQLALKYCEQSRTCRRYDAIFWVDAASQGSTIRGIEDIAEELRDKDQSLPDSKSRLAFVSRTLTSWERPWLLVFDNYDDPGAFDIRDYIPRGLQGNVLVTSRSVDAERIGTMLKISGMTVEESKQLLLGQSQLPDTEGNQIHAEKIVARLGRLPLAIDQAGAYINSTGTPLEDFLQEYETCGREIFDTVPANWEYNDSSGGGTDSRAAAKTVFTTWNMSFSLLKPDTKKGKLQADLLSLLALFDTNNISEDLFFMYHSNCIGSGTVPECLALFIDTTGKWSSTRFSSTMMVFLRLSLINEFQPRSEEAPFAGVSLHPLVRDWIKVNLDPPSLGAHLAACAAILASSLLVCFETDEMSFLDSSFSISTEKRSVMLAHVSSWAAEFQLHKGLLYRPTFLQHGNSSRLVSVDGMLAQFLLDSSLLGPSLEIHLWLWDQIEPSSPHTINAKWDAGNCIVGTLIVLLREVEAETRARENLRYWQKLPGVPFELVSTCEYIWAVAMNRHIMADSAKALISTALESIPQAQRNTKRYHMFIFEQAESYSVLNDMATAKSLIQRLVLETTALGGAPIRKALWPYRSWDIAFSIITDMKTKDQLSSEFLENMVSRYGEDHILTLSAIRLRARVLLEQSSFSEAQSLIEICVKGILNSSSRDGVDALVFEGWGDILAAQGRARDAYLAYIEALRATDSQSAKMSYTRFSVLWSFAETAEGERDYELAESLWEHRLCHALAQAEGMHEVELVQTLYQLAQVKWLRNAEKMNEAIPLVDQALTFFPRKDLLIESDSPSDGPFEGHLAVGDELPESILEAAQPSKFPKPSDRSKKAAYSDVPIGTIYAFNFLLLKADVLLALHAIEEGDRLFEEAVSAFELVDNMEDWIVKEFIKSTAYYRRRIFLLNQDKQQIQMHCSWMETMARKRFLGIRGWESWLEEVLEPLTLLTTAPDQEDLTPNGPINEPSKDTEYMPSDVEKKVSKTAELSKTDAKNDATTEKPEAPLQTSGSVKQSRGLLRTLGRSHQRTGSVEHGLKLSLRVATSIARPRIPWRTREKDHQG